MSRCYRTVKVVKGIEPNLQRQHEVLHNRKKICGRTMHNNKSSIMRLGRVKELVSVQSISKSTIKFVSVHCWICLTVIWPQQCYLNWFLVG
jgi:hypothetical protein